MDLMRLYHNIEDSFFFHDTATTEIYTLSRHDALPISAAAEIARGFAAELFRSGRQIVFCHAAVIFHPPHVAEFQAYRLFRRKPDGQRALRAVDAWIHQRIE